MDDTRAGATLTDGTVRREEVSAERWLREGREVNMVVPGDVVEVVLDPEGLYPDVDRRNGRWEAGGAGPVPEPRP